MEGGRAAWGWRDGGLHGGGGREGCMGVEGGRAAWGWREGGLGVEGGRAGGEGREGGISTGNMTHVPSLLYRSHPGL